MDTVPFHFLMFALDVALIAGLIYWPYRRSAFGTLGGFILFSGVGLCGIVLFSRAFRSHIGQCVVEGLTYHGSIFLLVSAGFLFFRRQRIVGVLAALLGLSIFAVGFDMLVWEPSSLVVERYVIETPKLTKPIRVVFVSDIQTDRIGDYERRIMRVIQEQKADLIIFGGDYLQYYEGTPGVADLPERFRQLFVNAQLDPPLGAFAIAGNVDPMSEEGFFQLFKESTVEPVFFPIRISNLGINKGIGPVDLTLLHIFDSVSGVGKRGLADTDNFQIIAGHYPNYAIKDYMDADRAPDLMLAGHTHGGQVRIPGYGPIRIKDHGRDSYIPTSLYSGLFKFENGSHLLVSRGAGMERAWAPRVRFFCKPEICVIDIVPK